jgi:hypothetical protein
VLRIPRSNRHAFHRKNIHKVVKCLDAFEKSRIRNTQTRGVLEGGSDCSRTSSVIEFRFLFEVDVQRNCLVTVACRELSTQQHIYSSSLEQDKHDQTFLSCRQSTGV